MWAPFYTYHKIMAGLLDMYVLTGNTDALKVAEGMAQWVGRLLRRHRRRAAAAHAAHRVRRHERSARESGGADEKGAVHRNGAACSSSRAFSIRWRGGGMNCRAACEHQRSEDDWRGADVRGDRRPALRRHRGVFPRRGADCAQLRHRQYESRRALDNAGGRVEGTLRLDECGVLRGLQPDEAGAAVFGWTGDARWMDAYERALLNCRLGTQNAQGLKQYFFPLAAGYWRAYHSAEDSFWCCTGTGVEEFAKFTDTIYFHRGERRVCESFHRVYVGLEGRGTEDRADHRRFRVSRGRRSSLRARNRNCAPCTCGFRAGRRMRRRSR